MCVEVDLGYSLPTPLEEESLFLFLRALRQVSGSSALESLLCLLPSHARSPGLQMWATDVDYRCGLLSPGFKHRSSTAQQVLYLLSHLLNLTVIFKS